MMLETFRKASSMFGLKFCCFVLLQFCGSGLYAQDVCAPYYGKGYCTDYVKKKAGISQRGDGGSWPSNMPRTEVGHGDIAIIRSHNHVAFVEEVTRRDSSGKPIEVLISEMNWGRGLRDGTPGECVVTSNFGVRTERKISVSQAEFMRPGGFTQKSSKPSACKPKEDWIENTKGLNREIKELERSAQKSKERALSYKEKGDEYLAAADKSKKPTEKQRLKSKAVGAFEKAKHHLQDASNYLNNAKAKKAEAVGVRQKSKQAC